MKARRRKYPKRFYRGDGTLNTPKDQIRLCECCGTAIQSTLQKEMPVFCSINPCRNLFEFMDWESEEANDDG